MKIIIIALAAIVMMYSCRSKREIARRPCCTCGPAMHFSFDERGGMVIDSVKNKPLIDSIIPLGHPWPGPGTPGKDSAFITLIKKYHSLK